MGSQSVEAFVKLARGEVDCRRAIDVSRAVANEASMRVLLVLFVGPMNKSQLINAVGAKRDTVSPHLRRLCMLGLVVSERAACFNVFTITSRGRKLLESIAECAA